MSIFHQIIPGTKESQELILRTKSPFVRICVCVSTTSQSCCSLLFQLLRDDKWANSKPTEQSTATDEDYEIWLKAPENLKNGFWFQVYFVRLQVMSVPCSKNDTSGNDCCLVVNKALHNL